MIAVRNRPIGVPTSSISPARSCAASSPDIRPPVCMPDAQLEHVAARRRDDGISAAFVAIVDRAAHGDVLARMEGEGVAQRGRNLHGHAGGVLGDAFDGDDLQRMETKHGRARQMHLKYSKGSRQARQRCSALQGVEPNSLMHSVSREWQRGQRTRPIAAQHVAHGSIRIAPAARCRKLSSLRRPRAVIQSLLHAGDSTVVTSKSPTRRLAATHPRTELPDHFGRRATHIGGRQPHLEVAVGAAASTKRISPKSTMLKAGISGSSTAQSCHAARVPPIRARRDARRCARTLVEPSAFTSVLRIAALQILHLGQDVAQMLAVLAALAMPGMRAIRGPLQRRLAQVSASMRALHAACTSDRSRRRCRARPSSRSNSSSANSSTV